MGKEAEALCVSSQFESALVDEEGVRCGSKSIWRIAELPGVGAIAFVGLLYIDSVRGADVVSGFDVEYLLRGKFGVTIGNDLDAGRSEPELNFALVGWSTLGQCVGTGEKLFVAGGHDPLVGIVLEYDFSVEIGNDRTNQCSP